MSDYSLSKRESERFYSKATRDFDRWFFSLPRDKQQTLRDSGVLPYRETRGKAYVIAYDPEHKGGATMLPWDQPDPDDSETFYSREKVQDIVRRLLDTLEYSLDPRVRLHFLLVKLALKMPDAIDGKRVAKLFGITKAGVSFRVQRMRQILVGQSTNEKPNRETRSTCRVRLQQIQGMVREKRRDCPTKGKAKVSNHKG